MEVYENACRVCLNFDNESPMESIFATGKQQKLNECFPNYQVTVDDGLTEFICLVCSAELEIAYEFKKKMEKSYETLQKTIKTEVESEFDYDNFDCLVESKEEAIQPEIIESKTSQPLKKKRNSRKRTVSKVPIPDDLVCPLCKQIFYSGKGFLLHWHILHEEKTFSCTMCDQKFRTNKYLRRHLQSHEKTEYICDLCGKRYRIKDLLVTHMKSKHINNKGANLCTICGKSMSNIYSLYGHMRWHKPKLATQEGKPSKPKKPTTNKTYTCNICGKTFNYCGGLVQHRQIHSIQRPHPCSYCEKSFKRPSQKRLHERIHTGDKQFACSICGHAFLMKADMLKHERTHDKDLKYICIHCNKVFSDKAALIKHTKLSH